MLRYNTNYSLAKQAKKYFENFCNGAEDSFNSYKAKIKEPDITKEIKALDVAEKLFYDMVNKKTPITHSGYLKLFEMELRKDNIQISKYRLTMLDEAQDTNDVTLSIFYNINAQQRLIVGDRHQQIYSFRGSINAMQRIEAEIFYLTNSFRFNKTIGEKASNFLSVFRKERKTLIGKGKDQNKHNNTTAYITRGNTRLIQIFSEHMKNKKYIKPIRNPDSIFGLAINMERLKCNNLEHIDTEYNYLKSFMHDFQKLRTKQKLFNEDIFEYIQTQIQDEQDEHIKVIKLLEKYSNIESIYNYSLDCYKNTEEALLFATTAHTSKGLEWDNVIIENDFPDWYTIAQWYKKCSDINPSSIKNPFDFFVENIDNKEIVKNCNSQAFIDELNLYYVAITRAKYSVEDHTLFNILPKNKSEYNKEIIKAYN